MNSICWKSCRSHYGAISVSRYSPLICFLHQSPEIPLKECSSTLSPTHLYPSNTRVYFDAWSPPLVIRFRLMRADISGSYAPSKLQLESINLYRAWIYLFIYSISQRRHSMMNRLCRGRDKDPILSFRLVEFIVQLYENCLIMYNNTIK